MPRRKGDRRELTSAPAAAALPLSALLSQALVAFTIEFDNEAERQWGAHRTTKHGSTDASRRGLWLASMAMYCNCMQFVDEHGVSVSELHTLARTSTNLDGMRRWGYIRLYSGTETGAEAATGRAAAAKRPKGPRSRWVVRTTPAGLRAKEVWAPLFGEIEGRWRERFGSAEVDGLRQSLGAIDGQLELDLPDCLPILGYGLWSRGHKPREEAFVSTLGTEQARGRATLAGAARAHESLSALLSRTLLAFAIEFERESTLSLAISANVVRVLDTRGVRVRDLPLLSGVSKESISMALGVLGKRRFAVVEPDPTSSRWRVARLTPQGRTVQDTYAPLLGSIEARWRSRFGGHTVGGLRASLERIVGDGTAESSPLFRGLDPPPEGWRASVRRPSGLPHYPMVLHRGGYPDGS